MTDWPTDPYEKALAAEPHLRHIALIVDMLCTVGRARRRARRRQPMCAGCAWERIIKPLTTPWLGWSRGYRPEQAPERPRDSWKPINVTELMAKRDNRPKAANATEEWLRSSDAWNAVTGRWLAALDAADPASGHGLGCEPADVQSGVLSHG